MTTSTELTPARARARRNDRKWALIRWASPLVLLVLWQLGSAVGLIPQDVLPAPSLIVEAGIEVVENGQLADALRVSGVRVIEGLLLGGILGVGVIITEARGAVNVDILGRFAFDDPLCHKPAHAAREFIDEFDKL